MKGNQAHQDPLLSELHARFGRRLLKLCEAADFLAVGTSTVREWVGAGELQCIKLSDRAWRFQSQAIVDFIRSRDEVNNVAALPTEGPGRIVSPLRPASPVAKPKNPKMRRVSA